MVTRLLTALVGLAILAVALLFYNTIVFNIVVFAIVLIALHEVANVLYKGKKNGIYLVSSLFAAYVIFFDLLPIEGSINLGTGFFVYAILLLGLMVHHHGDIKAGQIALMFIETVIITLAFGSTMFLRWRFPEDALFFLIVGLGSAWLADTCAYFGGRFFGKHKLAPNVSPNKTVEGAIAGVIGSVIIILGIGFGYQLIFKDVLGIHYFSLALVALVASIAGILGDLVASCIKREYGVKDYGTIMPGHGGVMDRFDSMTLTLPMVLVLTYYLPIVIR